MTIEQLLTRIASLLYFADCWHARARGSDNYAQGHTARAAIYAALGITDDDEL